MPWARPSRFSAALGRSRYLPVTTLFSRSWRRGWDGRTDPGGSNYPWPSVRTKLTITPSASTRVAAFVVEDPIQFPTWPTRSCQRDSSGHSVSARFRRQPRRASSSLSAHVSINAATLRKKSVNPSSLTSDGRKSPSLKTSISFRLFGEVKKMSAGRSATETPSSRAMSYTSSGRKSSIVRFRSRSSRAARSALSPVRRLRNGQCCST